LDVFSFFLPHVLNDRRREGDTECRVISYPGLVLPLGQVIPFPRRLPSKDRSFFLPSSYPLLLRCTLLNRLCDEHAFLTTSFGPDSSKIVIPQKSSILLSPISRFRSTETKKLFLIPIFFSITPPELSSHPPPPCPVRSRTPFCCHDTFRYVIPLARPSRSVSSPSSEKG